jgi:hypothetical protein
MHLRAGSGGRRTRGGETTWGAGPSDPADAAAGALPLPAGVPLPSGGQGEDGFLVGQMSGNDLVTVRAGVRPDPGRAAWGLWTAKRSSPSRVRMANALVGTQVVQDVLRDHDPCSSEIGAGDRRPLQVAGASAGTTIGVSTTAPCAGCSDAGH